ncbi:MAG TPA: hypothetical protein VKN74_07255 [Candidatus Mcinerneyibacterium sp.]|nr:hypothetical protein [Candidatus Mcinerneyibacterium sp.]
MENDEKKKLIKKNIEFNERLEYLIRDIDMLEKTVADIETDLEKMYSEFDEIKEIIADKSKGNVFKKMKKNEDNKK